MKIKIELTVEMARAVASGVAELLSQVELRDNGTLTIPVNLGNGMVMNNPAPCGTWELVDA